MSYDPATPFDPAAPFGAETGTRPKTGGRQKGTPNKSTRAIRDAVLEVFAELQDEAGRENGHFIDWARDNPTDFYRLTMRLLPRTTVIPDSAPAITEIRRTIVSCAPRQP